MPGHPPRQTSSTRFVTVVRLRCAGTGSPRNMIPRDISPVECPDSKSDIGRIQIRDTRPVPVCRVVSSGGTAEPVRMKRPAPPPMSTARRTWFQIDGTVCHSSIRRGAGPSRTRLGSSSAACRSPASTSSSTSLAAWCRPVAVFPQARGPSISTAPTDPSLVASSSSTMRGRYCSTRPSLPAGWVRFPIGATSIEVSQHVQSGSCNEVNRDFATKATGISQISPAPSARGSIRGGDRDACFSRSECAPYVNARHGDFHGNERASRPGVGILGARLRGGWPLQQCQRGRSRRPATAEGAGGTKEGIRRHDCPDPRGGG